MKQYGKSCAFIVSNSKITLYGCCGVDKYSGNEIVAELCDMTVTISGSELDMATYVCGEITVTGTLSGLIFARKGGGSK